MVGGGRSQLVPLLGAVDVSGFDSVGCALVGGRLEIPSVHYPKGQGHVLGGFEGASMVGLVYAGVFYMDSRRITGRADSKSYSTSITSIQSIFCFRRRGGLPRSAVI